MMSNASTFSKLKARIQMSAPPIIPMPERTLSEKSPISFGLIIGIIMFVVTFLGAIGAFGIALWQSGRWVGEINTALQGISLDIKIVKNDQTELKLKWEGHEARITKIETAGSPNLQELTRQVISIQRTLDLHTAKDTKP